MRQVGRDNDRLNGVRQSGFKKSCNKRWRQKLMTDHSSISSDQSCEYVTSKIACAFCRQVT